MRNLILSCSPGRFLKYSDWEVLTLLRLYWITAYSTWACCSKAHHGQTWHFLSHSGGRDLRPVIAETGKYQDLSLLFCAMLAQKLQGLERVRHVELSAGGWKLLHVEVEFQDCGAIFWLSLSTFLCSEFEFRIPRFYWLLFLIIASRGLTILWSSTNLVSISW